MDFEKKRLARHVIGQMIFVIRKHKCKQIVEKIFGAISFTSFWLLQALWLDDDLSVAIWFAESAIFLATE